MSEVAAIKRGQRGQALPGRGWWRGQATSQPYPYWRIVSGEGTVVATSESPHGWSVRSERTDSPGLIVQVPVDAPATGELPYQLFFQSTEAAEPGNAVQARPSAAGDLVWPIYHFTVPVTVDLRGRMGSGHLQNARRLAANGLAPNGLGLTRYATPHLSVIIACYGKRPLTEQCIQSLRADVPEAEIILVDNASPDDTLSWAQQQALKVVRFAHNRGVAAAWNAGLRAATGDVLCVLNNDTLIHAGGMRQLARAAWDMGIAAFHGGVLDQELNFVRMTRDPDEATYADGCALAFRREVWQTVGEFDEGFELGYCEDTDWSLRAHAMGLRWALCPEMLTHLGHQTAGALPDMPAHRQRNLERLRLRWSGKGVGERIVVRRWGALGDVLMVTPVLAALRETKPLARLHLQCAPSIAEFFQGLECVDTISADGAEAHTSRYDLDEVYEVAEQRGCWRHPTLAFAEKVGVALASGAYHLPLATELAAWARAKLPGQDYVACGLRSCFRPKANWAEAQWVALAQSLPGTTFVALDPLARPGLEVKGDYKGVRFYDLPNVLDLTGQTPTLRHALALLQRCAACVSVDTGMLHLASAAELPLVALVGGAAGWARAPLVGRYQILQGAAPCYPCRYAARCPREDGPHCLAWIDGQRVAQVLQSLLCQ